MRRPSRFWNPWSSIKIAIASNSDDCLIFRTVGHRFFFPADLLDHPLERTIRLHNSKLPHCLTILGICTAVLKLSVPGICVKREIAISFPRRRSGFQRVCGFFLEMRYTHDRSFVSNDELRGKFRLPHFLRREEMEATGSSVEVVVDENMKFVDRISNFHRIKRILFIYFSQLRQTVRQT